MWCKNTLAPNCFLHSTSPQVSPPLIGSLALIYPPNTNTRKIFLNCQNGHFIPSFKGSPPSKQQTSTSSTSECPHTQAYFSINQFRSSHPELHVFLPKIFVPFSLWPFCLLWCNPLGLTSINLFTWKLLMLFISSFIFSLKDLISSWVELRLFFCVHESSSFKNTAKSTYFLLLTYMPLISESNQRHF